VFHASFVYNTGDREGNLESKCQLRQFHLTRYEDKLTQQRDTIIFTSSMAKLILLYDHNNIIVHRYTADSSHTLKGHSHIRVARRCRAADASARESKLVKRGEAKRG